MSFFFVVNKGMGGFLNPPGHPEHSRSVEEYCIQTEKGSMSLTWFLSSAKKDDKTRFKVKNILEKWEKSKPSSPDQKWVRRVLGYFAGCYQSPDGSWDATHLLVDTQRNPMDFQREHAGIHFIRKFYPKFKATKEDFQKAEWK